MGCVFAVLLPSFEPSVFWVSCRIRMCVGGLEVVVLRVGVLDGSVLGMMADDGFGGKR